MPSHTQSASIAVFGEVSWHPVTKWAKLRISNEGAMHHDDEIRQDLCQLQDLLCN